MGEGHPIGRKLVQGEPLTITVGCSAPDGPVHLLDLSTSTLHTKIQEHFNTAQLTLLMFGSFTCPMYYGKIPAMVAIAQPYINAGQLSALVVYVREGHPADGWTLGNESSHGQHMFKQARTLEDRVSAAKAFAEARKDVLGAIPVLVDDPTTNCLDVAYEAPPCRLVVVTKELKVVYATGCGPLAFDVDGCGEF